jgi:hypothetical protein
MAGVVGNSVLSREVTRERAIGLLEMSLAPETGAGIKVGETGAWLLAHASLLCQEGGEEATQSRLIAAYFALIACRHKQVFGMAAAKDMEGLVVICRHLARIYAEVGEETAEQLPPAAWADPKPSWKALQLGVVGAASEATAALRTEAGLAEAKECMNLGIVLLEMGAQMALHDDDEVGARENWAAITIAEFPLAEFDPMRVVPLMYFKGMAETLNEIAGAYALGKDFEWAFTDGAGT